MKFTRAALVMPALILLLQVAVAEDVPNTDSPSPLPTEQPLQWDTENSPIEAGPGGRVPNPNVVVICEQSIQGVGGYTERGPQFCSMHLPIATCSYLGINPITGTSGSYAIIRDQIMAILREGKFEPNALPALIIALHENDHCLTFTKYPNLTYGCVVELSANAVTLQIVLELWQKNECNKSSNTDKPICSTLKSLIESDIGHRAINGWACNGYRGCTTGVIEYCIQSLTDVYVNLFNKVIPETTQMQSTMESSNSVAPMPRPLPNFRPQCENLVNLYCNRVIRPT